MCQEQHVTCRNNSILVRWGVKLLEKRRGRAMYAAAQLCCRVICLFHLIHNVNLQTKIGLLGEFGSFTSHRCQPFKWAQSTEIMKKTKATKCKRGRRVDTSPNLTLLPDCGAGCIGVNGRDAWRHIVEPDASTLYDLWWWNASRKKTHSREKANTFFFFFFSKWFTGIIISWPNGGKRCWRKLFSFSLMTISSFTTHDRGLSGEAFSASELQRDADSSS